MFQVSTEFRKGVFFIRLVGRIDNGSYLKEISKLVEYFGITYIVFNISDLNNISLEIIKHIIQYQKQMLEKNKILVICDINQKRNRLFKNIIPRISNELEVFSYI